MKTVIIAIISSFFLITSVSAESVVDQNGRSYKVIYNKHGAILKSGKRRLYLGRTCAAYSQKYSKGKWEQMNGGFIINFRKRTFSFGRQELQFGEKCIFLPNS